MYINVYKCIQIPVYIENKLIKHNLCFNVYNKNWGGGGGNIIGGNILGGK